jgi:hypothetical protein
VSGHDPDAELFIEPSAGETYGPAFGAPPEYGVYAYGTYPEDSVLAGRERRSCVDSGFASEAEAQAAYPGAVITGGSGYRELIMPDTPPRWFDPAIAGETW